MGLRHELADLLNRYLAGRTSLSEVRDWLEGSVQAVEDAADPRLDRLSGDVWCLLSEMDYGHRDEAAVRAELVRLLSAETEAHAATEATTPRR